MYRLLVDENIFVSHVGTMGSFGTSNCAVDLQSSASGYFQSGIIFAPKEAILSIYDTTKINNYKHNNTI